MDLGQGEDNHRLNWYHCNSGFPLDYLEGLLKDIVVVHENDDGWRRYGLDRDRCVDFMDGMNWSAPHHAAQAWVVTLASLLMDYRYLYL